MFRHCATKQHNDFGRKNNDQDFVWKERGSQRARCARPRPPGNLSAQDRKQHAGGRVRVEHALRRQGGKRARARQREDGIARKARTHVRQGDDMRACVCARERGNHRAACSQARLISQRGSASSHCSRRRASARQRQRGGRSGAHDVKKE